MERLMIQKFDPKVGRDQRQPRDPKGKTVRTTTHIPRGNRRSQNHKGQHYFRDQLVLETPIYSLTQ